MHVAAQQNRLSTRQDTLSSVHISTLGSPRCRQCMVAQVNKRLPRSMRASLARGSGGSQSGRTEDTGEREHHRRTIGVLNMAQAGRLRDWAGAGVLHSPAPHVWHVAGSGRSHAASLRTHGHRGLGRGRQRLEGSRRGLTASNHSGRPGGCKSRALAPPSVARHWGPQRLRDLMGQWSGATASAARHSRTVGCLLQRGTMRNRQGRRQPQSQPTRHCCATGSARGAALQPSGRTCATDSSRAGVAVQRSVG
ncbi:hypothetical protein PSPO01_00042 [Paraphaeosphaeria sporulosa]